MMHKPTGFAANANSLWASIQWVEEVQDMNHNDTVKAGQFPTEGGDSVMRCALQASDLFAAKGVQVKGKDSREFRSLVK